MASLGLVADVDDDGQRASHNGRPASSEAKPKPKAKARAATNADPKTGEVLVNLTKDFMAAVPAERRAEFLAMLQKEHGVEQIAKVPQSKEKVVREAIAAARSSSDGDEL